MWSNNPIIDCDSKESQINLFMIAKMWNQPDWWIKKIEYSYTMEYYLASKNWIDADICDKVDKPEGQYIKRSKPETKQYISAFIHM